MRGMHKVGLAVWLLALAGCATVDTVSSHAHVDKKARWAMLPVVNHTDTPQAGLRAEGLAESLLRSEGVEDVTSYPANLSDDTLLEPSQRRAQEAARELEQLFEADREAPVAQDAADPASKSAKA